MKKVLLFFFLNSAFMVLTAVAVPDGKNEYNKDNIVSKSTGNASKTSLINVSNTGLDAKHISSEKSSENKLQADLSKKFNKLDVDKNNLNTKEITFDFPNTNLKIFAEFVAKLTKKILIGEELLNGKVDIKTQRSMDLNEVERLFDGILATYGLESVKTEDCIEIVQVSDSYVEVYELEYLKADDLAKALTQAFRTGFRVNNRQVNIEISALKGSNAVMVLAPKSYQFEIKSSIEKLDTKVRQVLLEVLVLELTKTGSLGLGVEFQYGDDAFVATETGVLSGLLSQTSTPKPAISYNYTWGNAKIGVNAGEEDTRYKVLSQPRIMGLDNQKSQIKIVKKQPYANGSTSENSGLNLSTTTQTTTEEVGLDLTITPRVNKKNDVTLELKLKITSIVGSDSMAIGLDNKGFTVNQDVPVIGHRIVNNTSIVKNGKTLVIGGLLENQKLITTTAPPILGDLPWIGFMFANTTETAVQTELMIYITPTIVENIKQLRNLTKTEIQKLRDYDPKEKETIDQMLTGKKTKADDTFKLYDYLSGKRYRKNQSFIPEPENL